MKKILSLIATAAVMAFAGAAHAEAIGPAWTCQLSGNLSGYSISPLVSFQRLRGTGYVTCDSADTKVVRIPVALELVGAGVGVGFSKIENITLYSTQIGLTDGPEGLIGRYSVGATAGVTLLKAGVDFDAALSVAKVGGLSFELGLKGKDAQGLEAKLQGMAFKVTRL